MNYAALTVDELVARCSYDPEARAFAGEHFRELTDRLEEEWREQFYADYEIAVEQAAGALLEQHIDRMTPHYDVPAGSDYWRIG